VAERPAFTLSRRPVSQLSSSIDNRTLVAGDFPTCFPAKIGSKMMLGTSYARFLGPGLPLRRTEIT